MKFAVRLFARARDLAEAERVELELPEGARVGDVRAMLGERHPALRPVLPSLLFAIDHEYAGDSEPVPQDATEIACFPPVSGG
ncbi:MAG: MoaD/ThiS family protein [Planctomycetaceae bacterium]